MFISPSPQPSVRSDELGYWLRRAEQESIAAIRATGAASERHDAMARAYSALARHLLD